MNVLSQNYKIDVYNNQILSVCLRLLQEFRNSEEVIHTVADTYFSVLKSTTLKQELLMSLLTRLKTFGQNLIQSFYYLVKAIVNSEV